MSYEECPVDFEQGLDNSCHARCPSDFKYFQEPGGVGGRPIEKCIYIANNAYQVSLMALPQPVATQSNGDQYDRELERFKREIEEIRARARQDMERRQNVAKYKEEDSVRGIQYARLQGEYAGISEVAAGSTYLKEVSDSLKPFRPKTAPGSDIEIERRAIQTIVRQNLTLIQAVLVLVILALLSALVLPATYAQYVTFLLLCVGVAIGIFLRK
jgi:hypothetical protein